MDDKAYEAWLDYLDNGGTTAEWEKMKATGLKDTTAAKALDKPQNNSTISSELSDDDTKAIFGYMSAHSYAVNEKLRSGATLSKEDGELVENLDRALQKMPTYTGNLQRSLLFSSNEDVTAFMKDYKIGGKVTYKEYISTTKGETYNPDGQVQIFIANSKRGRDISSLNPGEAEVLYERNSSFVVVDVVENDGKYYILVEEADE